MSKKIQKSLSVCLSKIKTSNKRILLSSKRFSSSTNWILRACKHPKTPSIAIPSPENGEEHDDYAATLSDVDQFLFENFRSLYQKEFEENNRKKGLKENEEKKHAGAFFSPRLLGPPPRHICSSNRFFVTPGSSSSLLKEPRSAIVDVSESSRSFFFDGLLSECVEGRGVKGKGSCSFFDDSTSERLEGRVKAPDDFITILTYSPSPYHEFRRSMQEMVQTRLEHNGKVDWEFMQELLFCYLDMNDKKSYRYILGAFVDLIIGLREKSGSVKAEK